MHALMRAVASGVDRRAGRGPMPRRRLRAGVVLRRHPRRVATFGLPEIGLAAFPPVAAALLPLRVGASRAAARSSPATRRPPATGTKPGWCRSCRVVDVAGRRPRLVRAAPGAALGRGAVACRARGPGRMAAGSRAGDCRERAPLPGRAVVVSGRRGGRAGVDGEASAGVARPRARAVRRAAPSRQARVASIVEPGPGWRNWQPHGT